MCDYNDADIVVKEKIDLLAAVANKNDKAQKGVAFKNNAPFTSCISKINNKLTDNADDLDTVLRMYNILEYGDNYSMTSGSLCNYHRDEIDGVDDNSSDGKSFEYKTKITRKSPREHRDHQSHH